MSAELNKTIGQELLKIHSELEGIGILMPETLTNDKTESIQKTLDELEQEANMMSQPAIAEVLSGLRVDFYTLHTIGTVDDTEKFQRQAAFIFDKLETVLLMLPSTSGEVLENIKKQRERN